MRAVALLTMWKSRNMLRSLLTDPRKLIPALIAVVYFGFLIIFFGFGSFARATANTTQKVPAGLFESAIFLGFLLVAITVIDNGLGDNLLASPPADVDYLFPSPIARRVVLAFRLPALTFGASFFASFILFLYRMASRAISPQVDHPGNITTSKGIVILGAILCVGVYMNLAMFLAIRIKNRRALHRVVVGFLFLLAAGLGLLGVLKGVDAVVHVAASPWLRWPFFPSNLEAQIMLLRAERLPTGAAFLSLLGLYALSMIPMFVTNANFYEESIASTERIGNLRRAARGGWAALASARAAGRKYEGRREYTVPPFGEGAGALFWAHLCASCKQPYATFVTPIVGGAAVGVFATLANRQAGGIGFVLLGTLVAYSGFGFAAAARTASEAAIRRREIIATLPIPGAKAVAANLGVPVASLTLFALCVSLGYAVSAGSWWPLVVTALLLVFVPRTASRMTIMYMLALAYPDFADKLQQFLGQIIYYLFGAPLLLFEAALCIPAFFLHSLWAAVVPLAIFEFVLWGLLTLLAGKVSERAVATGEPVRFWRLRKT